MFLFLSDSLWLSFLLRVWKFYSVYVFVWLLVFIFWYYAVENLLPSCVNTCRSVRNVDICKLKHIKCLDFEFKLVRLLPLPTPPSSPLLYHFRKPPFGEYPNNCAWQKDNQTICRFTVFIHGVYCILYTLLISNQIRFVSLDVVSNCTYASHCIYSTNFALLGLSANLLFCDKFFAI